MDSILSKLSVVNVIWIIAAGVTIFLLLFLFAKRQIMRFTLESHRGPHLSIGANAPKKLRQEIFRRINCVPEIVYEPILLNPAMERLAKSGPNHFYYRMQAVDAFSKFDGTLRREYPAACRHANQTMRNYLITIYPEYLSAASPDLVNQFVALYEHARHRPEVFDESHFQKYSQLLNELVECLEHGITLRKKDNIEQLKQLPLIETEVKLKLHHKGIGKARTSIPYNQMSSSEKYNRLQTRYRTRANSSEQTGLLESGPSSQRSSVDGLVADTDCSEEVIKMVQVSMNTLSGSEVHQTPPKLY